MAGKAFNPLQKENLGHSVATALLESPVRSFDQLDELFGAGVYAIYYTGPCDLYAPIVARNVGGVYDWPLYVGKAIPKGGRKGGIGFDSELGRALRDRLGNHAKSIAEAENLDLADFAFRALVVDDIWIPLGENVLIERFRPVWNLVVDGFGNKTPGANRSAQKRSSWDVLHPGRRFAQALTGGVRLSEDELRERLRRYFEKGEVTIEPDEAMIREEDAQEE